eukprot:jgi/Bigna1/146655/aug1.118_g21363
MYFEGYTQCQLNDVSKWTIEVEQLSPSSSSSSSSPAAAASSSSSPSSNQTRNDSNLITFDGYGYGYKSCLNPKNGAPATDAMESNCKPVAITLKYTADENFLKIRIPSSRSLLFQYNTISTPQSSSSSSSSEPWCHCQISWQLANAADEIPELRKKVLRVVATKNPNALQGTQ